eukprot:32238_1
MLSFNSDNSKIEDIMESIANHTVNHDEDTTVVEAHSTDAEDVVKPGVAEDTTVAAALLTDAVDEDTTTVDVPTGAKKPNEHVVHSSDDAQTPPKKFSIHCEDLGYSMWNGYSSLCTYDIDFHKHGANPTSDVFVRVGVIFYDGMPGTVDKVELDGRKLERDNESEDLSFIGSFARSGNKESYPLKITVKPPTNSSAVVRNIKISIETKSVNADVTADTTPAAKHLTANLDTDQQNLLQNASESEEQEDVKEQTTVDTTPAGNSLLTRGLNWAWWKAG